MKKSIFIVSFALGVIFFLSGVTAAQAPPRPAQSSLVGVAKGGTYTIDRLGLSLQYPKEWIIADQEASAAAARVGVDTIRGTNQRDNNAIEDALNVEVPLLNLTKKPMGAIGNAAFVMVARRLPSPAITAVMVAEATKSVFDTSPTLKLVGDTRVKTISGKKFALLDYEMRANLQRANIKAYITIINGYVLTFSLTYSDENDLIELNKIVDSLKFSAR